MDPIDTNLDLELLAALADGRLKGAERARALKMLANSDDALELYANTVRELRDRGVPVLPISMSPRWRQWKVMVPLAAAATLAIVMVPRMTGSKAPVGLANEYAMELAGIPNFAGGLGDGWEQRGWSVTRGAGGSRDAGTPRPGSAVESRLAFRLGVRSTDVQVALRRGDTALAGRVTSEVLETLGAIEFADAAAAKYKDLKSKLSTEPLARSVEGASAAERELSEFLGSSSFTFGQWVGAADLAAQMHDASFLTADHGTSFIRSRIPTGGLAAEDLQALQSIDVRMAAGVDDRALDDVHVILQTVIRRRGS